MKTDKASTAMSGSISFRFFLLIVRVIVIESEQKAMGVTKIDKTASESL